MSKESELKATIRYWEDQYRQEKNRARVLTEALVDIRNNWGVINPNLHREINSILTKMVLLK